MPGLRQEVLNSILKPEYVDAGYSIDDDEDYLYLKKENKILAVWYVHNIKAEVLRNQVDNFISTGYFPVQPNKS